MKDEFIKAIENGTPIKEQTFNTEKGRYELFFYNCKNDIYFFKLLNDTVVECVNLSKLSRGA